MNQEFVTTTGKVIKEGNTLLIRNLTRRFHNTLVYELFIPVAWFIAAIARYLTATNNFEYFFAIVIGLIAISRGYPIYDVLFRRSLAKRIPLDSITNYQLTEYSAGLETVITLQLKTGRYKRIEFRTLENQHVPFLAAISPYLAATQSA